jgi:N-acetylglutamate synthase-like GNAT family acetyltransferase
VKKRSHPLTIRQATSANVPIILELIRALATYELRAE